MKALIKHDRYNDIEIKIDDKNFSIFSKISPDLRSQA